jgi:hypothetical protein
MKIQETFRFNKNDFDENGFNVSGKHFEDIISEWEVEFRNSRHIFANHLFANSSTMYLLKRCFTSTGIEDYGMDGEIDFNTNLEIETYSKRQTIYALGSRLEWNIDKPLFLIRDDKVSDGTVILEFILNEDEKQKKYSLNIDDFEENGFNKFNGIFILDFINNCEEDFHKCFNPLFAVSIYSNDYTMDMLLNFFLLLQDEDKKRYSEFLLFEGAPWYAIRESQVEGNKNAPIIYDIDSSVKNGIVLKSSSHNGFIIQRHPPDDTKNTEL